MASLMLGVAGAWLGGKAAGAVLGAIGSGVGAILDSRLIIPAIFPEPSPDAQITKLDTEVKAGVDGSPTSIIIGPYARTKMFPFWIGPVDEGTGLPRFISEGYRPRRSVPATTRYFAHIAVAPTIGKEVVDILKIWAGDIIIYDRDIPQATYTYDDLVLNTEQVVYPYHCREQQETYAGGYFPPPADYGTGFLIDCMVITSPADSVDLTRLAPGPTWYGLGNFTTTGFTNSVNNGTHIFLRTIKDYPSTGETSLMLLPTPETIIAAGGPSSFSYVDEASPTGVTLAANPSQAPTGFYAEDVTIYTGAPDQAVDSLISASQGAANTPAFRGTPYALLEKLPLWEFGNRLPYEFEAIVEVDAESYTVGDAIGQVLEELGGFTPAQYDVSQVTATFHGMSIQIPETTGSVLAPILQAFNLTTQERSGVYHFIPRDSNDTVVIASGDIAASTDVEMEARPFDVEEVPPSAIPYRLTVSYRDKDFNCEKMTQSAVRPRATTKRVATVQLPLTMTGDEAKDVAATKLWSDFTGRFKIKLSLPPTYHQLLESDILQFTNDGITYEVIATKVEEGANDLILVEAIVEAASGSSQSESADTLPGPDAMLLPSTVQLHLLDLPAIYDPDALHKGVYYLAAPIDATAKWPGFTLYESSELDGEYQAIDTIESECKWGWITSFNFDGSCKVGVWDNRNTLYVRMARGVPASATEQEIFAGANRVMVGNEVIHYKTATLLGGTTYILTGLLRGVRGTGEEIDNHALGDVVVFLDHDSMNFRVMDDADIGSQRYYKAVPPNYDIASVGPTIFTLEGRTIQPFGPVYVTAHRRTSAEATALDTAWPDLPVTPAANDLVFTFHKRTRALTRPFGSSPVPVLEDGYEGPYYIGQMFDASDDSFLRTLTNDHEILDEYRGIGQNQVVYYASQQTTDGLTVPTDTVKAWFYQVPDAGGPGVQTSTEEYA